MAVLLLVCAHDAAAADGAAARGLGRSARRRIPRASRTREPGAARATAASGRRDAHARRLRPSRRRRHRRRARAADDRRDARRLGARADPAGPDGARSAASTASRSRSSRVRHATCCCRAPGRSVLALDIVIPLTASAGAESITLPASPSPISRARLALPRSGVDLSLTGGFVADRTEATTESRWTVFGRPNPAAGPVVEAEGRRPPRGAAAARARAHDASWSGLAKSRARCRRRFAWRCCRGSRARSCSRFPAASSSTR